MSEHWDIYADWNPWHGCTKISPGCKYCYVYRQDEMYGSEIGSDVARKTANFNLPLKRRRDKSYKIPSGRMLRPYGFHLLHLRLPAAGCRPLASRMLGHDA